MVRVADVQRPECGSPQQKPAADVHCTGFVDPDQLRPLHVIVDSPAKPPLLIRRYSTPERVPPWFAVAVDGAAALDRDIRLAIDVEQRRGPCHLHAGCPGL